MSAKVEEKYPYLSNAYLDKLITCHPKSVGVQFLPNTAELDDFCLPADGLAERSQSPLPRVIHRYENRVVLLTTNRCAAHCRFCFRKRLWREQPADISNAEIIEVCRYLADNAQISEAIISGGDPLTLGVEKLSTVLAALAQVESIKILRLGTRVLSVNPALFSDAFIRILKPVKNFWLMTHFNHGDELTDTAIERCNAIAAAGIPMLNQCVLLKGINDDARVLESLFQKLLEIKVKPHYLFHIDPVQGVGHFATGVERGIEIMRRLRNSLSSLAMPVFAIDLPGGGGKVALQPDYQNKDGAYQKLDGEYIKYPY